MSENNNSNNSTITATIDANIVTRIPDTMLDHIIDTSNPHQVTCEQIGAISIDSDAVFDKDYIHTDNNYSDVDKNLLYSISEDYVSKSKIEEIDEYIVNNNDNIDNIYQSIDNINTDIDNITNTQNTTNNQISNIQTNISTIQKSINNVNSQLNKKADLDYVNDRLNDITNNNNGTFNPYGVNKNYLYNPTFSINSRGKTVYNSTLKEYTVDRWLKSENAVVGLDKNNKTYLKNTSLDDVCSLTQYIAYDNKNFANKNLSVYVSTDWGDFSFPVPEILPEDPENNSSETVFECMDTEFGMIEFGFHLHHYYLRIYMWQKETEGDDYSVILNYAKVEMSTEYSGFEYPDESAEKLACARFYQPFNTNNMWYPGYCQRNRQNTLYTTQLTTSIPMYKQPTNFINSNITNSLQVVVQGENPKSLTYNTLSTLAKSPDYRIFNFTFNLVEDNSDMEGIENGIYYWSALKFSGFAFEAEIYD